ncbi:hypothetical protein QOT17_004224 [Balamuthia mandrillaris]
MQALRSQGNRVALTGVRARTLWGARHSFYSTAAPTTTSAQVDPVDLLQHYSKAKPVSDADLKEVPKELLDDARQRYAAEREEFRKVSAPILAEAQKLLSPEEARAFEKAQKLIEDSPLTKTKHEFLARTEALKTPKIEATCDEPFDSKDHPFVTNKAWSQTVSGLNAAVRQADVEERQNLGLLVEYLRKHPDFAKDLEANSAFLPNPLAGKALSYLLKLKTKQFGAEGGRKASITKQQIKDLEAEGASPALLEKVRAVAAKEDSLDEEKLANRDPTEFAKAEEMMREAQDLGVLLYHHYKQIYGRKDRTAEDFLQLGRQQLNKVELPPLSQRGISRALEYIPRDEETDKLFLRLFEAAFDGSKVDVGQNLPTYNFPDNNKAHALFTELSRAFTEMQTANNPEGAYATKPATQKAAH